MKIARQIRRRQERKKKKERKKLIKKLGLSDFEYVADDKNMTFSASMPQMIDFLRVIGFEDIFDRHVRINKRKSPYSSSKIGELLVLQNILGIERIEGSRKLAQDDILKSKLNLDRYPDPETFRDELGRYRDSNIDELFWVNREILEKLCTLTEPGYIDLHFDSKVITVYGNQEGAEVGYNPWKPGRRSYHLKVCVIEPFGFVLAIELQPGSCVSSTGFIEFYKRCVEAVPQSHFVIRTVRLDRGFFSQETIESIEGDYLFFEIVAKQYSSIKNWISEYIAEDEFEPFYTDDTVSGTSFIYRFKNWDKPREFIVVRKLIRHDKDGQLFLFPRYSLQVICHNQMDMDPKEVWEDYNKRAKIELTIRDLDYDHYITNVPTGRFLSNFAYFWFCVFSYNLILIFKNFVLAGDWSQFRTSTIREKLLNIPGKLVNRSGTFCMRLMHGFPHTEVLQRIGERLCWLYGKLNPIPI